MSGLHIAHVKIVVGEYRAANRADEDGVVLDAQFFYRVPNQFVSDAVPASRTIMRLMLQLGLTLEAVVKRCRFRMGNFVFQSCLLKDSTTRYRLFTTNSLTFAISCECTSSTDGTLPPERP